MAEPLRHRPTNEAATDMFYLKPPRHISTLPWLRDNALPQPATVNDPVNVVRQGQSEQFFPVGRSGTVSELSWAMLGKGWPEIGSQWVSTLTL